MSRPKVAWERPAWFDLARYSGARDLDAADWYLNLALRQQVARKGDTFGERFIQQRGIIRRGDSDSAFVLGWAGQHLNSPILNAIFEGRMPRLGVCPLRTLELYAFEQMLPKEIRAAGAAFVPGETKASEVPPAFSGPLDAAFERRMLGAFARVDLSLPDEVLMQDFRRYLAQQREELETIEGRHPYREALAEVGSRYRPRVDTWARLAVLPFLDLQRWQRSSGEKFTDAALVEMLEINDHDLRETKRYAALLADAFVLDAWLLRFAREALEGEPAA